MSDKGRTDVTLLSFYTLPSPPTINVLWVGCPIPPMLSPSRSAPLVCDITPQLLPIPLASPWVRTPPSTPPQALHRAVRGARG